jgi:hypothetical protein
MNPPEAVPRVFISYSYDWPEHADRVVAVADRPRAEGIDCHLDEYETTPPGGLRSLNSGPKFEGTRLFPLRIPRKIGEKLNS